jgi:hypothetical protein
VTTTIDLKARTVDGHTLIVEAEPTAVPGLAIYQLPPEYLPEGWNTWRIVHTSSGLGVGTAPTRGNALGAVAYLADLADWTVDPDTLRVTVDGTAVLWAMHDAGCRATAHRDQQGAAA